MKYLLCMAYLVFSLLGLTFMKAGSMEGKRAVFQIFHLKFTMQSVAGYFYYMVSFFIYTFIIARFDLSYIIPLLGGAINILVFVIGVVVFQERATAFSVAGCMFIVAGVFLINIGRH